MKLRNFLVRARGLFRQGRCTGNPPGLASFEDFNQSHNWLEFDDRQYKCTYCGLVIGWPRNHQRVNMGLEPVEGPGYKPAQNNTVSNR